MSWDAGHFVCEGRDIVLRGPRQCSFCDKCLATGTNAGYWSYFHDATKTITHHYCPVECNTLEAVEGGKCAVDGALFDSPL